MISVHGSLVTPKQLEQQRTNVSAEVEPDLVSLPNILSQVHDVADDMAMLMSQFGRRRDLEKKREASSENMDRVLDQDSDRKLSQILKLLEKRGTTLSELMAMLRGLFPDDSDQILVLRELLRRKKLNAAMAAEVEGEIDSLLNGNKAKQTRAGINIALKAKRFGESLSLAPLMLRDLYRDFISMDVPPIYLYEDWITQFGESKRDLILNFILHSMVCDMQALVPSCQHAEEFGPLLCKINDIRAIFSADKTYLNGLSELKLGLERENHRESMLKLFIFGLTDAEKMREYFISLLQGSLERLLLSQKAMLVQRLLVFLTLFQKHYFL